MRTRRSRAHLQSSPGTSDHPGRQIQRARRNRESDIKCVQLPVSERDEGQRPSLVTMASPTPTTETSASLGLAPFKWAVYKAVSERSRPFLFMHPP